MSLSNVSVVAFHYRSYGTFCIYSKRLHNLYSGFTHYRNYRAETKWFRTFEAVFLLWLRASFSRREKQESHQLCWWLTRL